MDLVSILIGGMHVRVLDLHFRSRDDQLKVDSRLVIRFIHNSQETLVLHTKVHQFLGQVVFQIGIVDGAQLTGNGELFAVSKLRAKYTLNQVIDCGALGVYRNTSQCNRTDGAVRVGWFERVGVDGTGSGAFQEDLQMLT